jgi:hypothetical protein
VYSPDINKVIKLRNIKWAAYVLPMEEIKTAHEILAGKTFR